MKNIIKILLCPFVALMLVSCNETVKQPQTLKVMVWNVWNAGHQEKYPGKGWEGVIGIIKESGADVVLMVETYGSANKVADSLGYYHRLLSSNLSIYSRYPIKRTITFPDSISTFNFGGVEIDVNGKPILLFDTWLHYLPDARLAPVDSSEAAIIAWEKSGTRFKEITTILSVLAPFINFDVPLIFGGDFNGHSHLDWTEEVKNNYNHGGAVVNWSVSKALVDAGFKDSFREIHPNPADNIGTSWIEPVSPDLPDRADRIDYIYYKGKGIKAIESETYDSQLGSTFNFNGKDFFYASDHGFVLSTFEIN